MIQLQKIRQTHKSVVYVMLNINMGSCFKLYLSTFQTMAIILTKIYVFYHWIQHTHTESERKREREDERCSHCKSVKSYLNESNRKLSYVILVNARMEMGNDLNVEKRRERVCVCVWKIYRKLRVRKQFINIQIPITQPNPIHSIA